MAILVQMRHSKNGIYKNGFIGFSWTYLFFGFFVPLLRGHYAMAGIHFVIFVASTILMITWLTQPLMAFFFNKFYTRRLIEDGYYFDDDHELVKLAKSKLNVV